MEIVIIMGRPKTTRIPQDKTNFWTPQTRVQVESTKPRPGKNLLARMAMSTKRK